MKTQTQTEKRAKRRYELAMPVHFRLTRKGSTSTSRWATGAVHDMSSSGVSFACRGPLPLGSHLELSVEWPANRGEQHTTHLHATGLIVRSSGTVTAIEITWHRLDVEPAVAMPLSAIA